MLKNEHSATATIDMAEDAIAQQQATGNPRAAVCTLAGTLTAEQIMRTVAVFLTGDTYILSTMKDRQFRCVITVDAVELLSE